MSPQHIIMDNIEALTSGAGILELLTEDQYNRVAAPYFSASIGKHYRHILDHYLSFIKGLPENHINYDRRDREERLETDLGYALETIQYIIESLSSYSRKLESGFAQESVDVSLCTSCSSEITEPVPSSIQREMVFLQGHTTHHYAIIAAMLKFSEITVDNRFGVAPSTLKYQEQSQCAQ